MSHRPIPGKPPPAASRPRDRARRGASCCAGRCACRCAPRSAPCTTGPRCWCASRTPTARTAGARRGATSRRAAPSTARGCRDACSRRSLVGRAFASPAGGLRDADAARPPCSRCNPASRGRSRRRSPASTSRCTTSRRAAPACRCGASAARRPARTAPRCRVYASGINPERPGDTVAALRAAGHAAFKLKVGFGAARDVENLAAVRAAAGAEAPRDGRREPGLGPRHRARDGAARSRRSRPHGSRSRCAPIGRGPNGSASRRPRRCRSPPARTRSATAAFDALIAARAVARRAAGSREVGRHLRRARRRRAHRARPGCATARTTSAPASACSPRRTCSRRAARADGWLEVDANENPLRTALCPPLARLAAGGSRSTSGRARRRAGPGGAARAVPLPLAPRSS